MTPIRTIAGPRYSSIVDAIGKTPLMPINRLFEKAPFSVYAKLEGFNPGGSIKDRAALAMVRGAMERGLVRPGTTLIESSSGNLGIGLAQLCRYYGIPFICVVDLKTTAQNIQIMRAWGAKIEIVHEPDPLTGDFLPARIRRVKQLLREEPDSFWCNQYANQDNPRAHYETMREIVEEFDGQGPDWLVCAVSSCGTLRGCAEYIRSRGLSTKVVAVDAVGSVIFGGRRRPRLLPGHGAARVPEHMQEGLADRVVWVDDWDCVVGCHGLLQREALLAGGSSGGVVAAVQQIADDIPAGARCAVVLCDRGERYLDTIFSEDWLHEHFGDVPFSFDEPDTFGREASRCEAKPAIAGLK